MTTFQNAFISYGRADSLTFASDLNQRLMAAGLSIWFDFDDIPLGVDYQKQIDAGIQTADNFLFIISPHAVNSPYCGLEIELALKRGKRIIPLLHVEEISRETWQQRHPDGTDEQWAAYQAAGKHSCFPNMHPDISKINWVYFREGLDDFETSFQGLLAIFERQKDYVRQHTQLLAAALEWEAHQKRSQFLLTGRDRQQAEAWLQTRFGEEQPPCLPTDLHCEFITESIKNAHNLMTQVFLAHAEADAPVMAQIRQVLQREGITVWTSATDIRSGEDFRQAIERGIEQADNLVYLLSPASQASKFCQHELDYALSLNKRLIPILVQSTEAELIPEALRGLQYIAWKAAVAGDKLSAIDHRPLLKALKEDAAYYNEHKVLLTQALKWERQQRNPSILLRGYNLRHAEAWWKVAQTRSRHRPTALQSEFLQESLRQPPAQSLDVFISYSRVDSDFARRLNEALQIQGKRTWFDQESIASGTDFQQEIYRGIETSGHFLFILSPEAVRSPYCADEVEYARKLNKRIVTVLHRAIDTSDLHPVLAAIQWIDFRQQDGDFNANFKELLRTLESDRDHLEAHTRLLVRALEWDKKDQSKDLLLRGQELEAVIVWLTQNAEKEPRSSQIQRDYINASRLEAAAQQQAQLEHEATVRKRITRALIAAVGGFVIAVGLGSAAFQQFRRAETQRQEAVQAEVEALISSANALLDSEQPLDALIESLKAAHQIDKFDARDSVLSYQVAGTLHQAITMTQELNRLSGHAHWVEAVAFSPKDDVFATAGRDGAVRIWKDQGQLIMTIEGQKGDKVDGLSFSPDGQTLAASINEVVKIFDLQGQELRHFPGHSDTVTELSFSPDGKTLASAAWDGTVAVWSLEGSLQTLLEAHDSPALDIKFSPDGTMLASAGVDGLIKLWDRSGNLLKSWHGDAGSIHRVAFSPDGTILASAGVDGTVKLWNTAGELLQMLAVGDENLLFAVEFSSDGQRLAIATDEHNTSRPAVRVWSIAGVELERLEGHGSRITDVSFSADGRHIASTSFDGSVRLWQPQHNTLFQVLEGHNLIVSSLKFDTDGQTLVSSSYDGTIRLWQADGTPLKTLDGHTAAVNAIELNPHQDIILSASDDQTIKAWTFEGELKSNLEEHSSEVKSVSISPDGTVWASTSQDGTLKLWSKDGEVLKTLPIETGLADIVRFHPQDPVLAIAIGKGTERNVVLWNWQQDKLTPLNTSGDFQVRDLQFSPDGKLLATASWHGNLTFWTLTGDRQYSFFAGYSGSINALEFSPNGQLIAITSGPSILLYDRQGQVVQSFRATEHHNPFSLRFSPDGKTLVSGHRYGDILLWNLDLEALVQAGCQKSAAFLQSHPETLMELPLCQTPERLRQGATVLVNEAIVQARQGNTDAALRTFELALAWNPDLDFDPQVEVKQFFRQGNAHRQLEEGDYLASEGNLSGAIEKYQAAKALDHTLTFESDDRAKQQALAAEVKRLVAKGKSLAGAGNIEDAIVQFQAAKSKSPHLAIIPNLLAQRLAAEAKIAEATTAINEGKFSEALLAFNQARNLHSNLTINSDLLNDLCWSGSLSGAAETVITICDQAVAAAPENADIRDSRGLARTLTGDLPGAIADFQFFVDQTSDEVAKKQRQYWIAALSKGENPFTEEVLQQLQ